MNFVLRMLCLTAAGMLFTSVAVAEERIWTGLNGRTFRGTFLNFEENRTKAIFFTSANEQITVALENLIPADRERLGAPAAVPAPDPLPTPTVSATPTAPPVADTGDGFKKLPNANRAIIPDVKSKDLGKSSEEALVDAIWISLLWWEKASILEVPGRGDSAKRAEGLHEDLSREIAKGGRSSATLEEGKKGIEEYFKDNLSDTAACRVTIVKDRLTVPVIAAALVESRAVVMKMSMKYDNGRDFSVATVLESLTPEGKFTFHVFGTRLHGEVKTAADGKQEWIVANRDAIPEYYRNQGALFFFNQEPWNGILIMEPFVYATKGKPSPLPPQQDVKPAPPVAPVR